MEGNACFLQYYVLFFRREREREREIHEGHSLCFAIWIFKNIYNHSVYSSF